ncbi:MAG: hypothetical protein WC596_00130 [Candidatus Shapirobacteria bacterium]
MQANSREQSSALTAYQTKVQETLQLCQKHRCSFLDSVTGICTGKASDCPQLPQLRSATVSGYDFEAFVVNM